MSRGTSLSCKFLFIFSKTSLHLYYAGKTALHRAYTDQCCLRQKIISIWSPWITLRYFTPPSLFKIFIIYLQEMSLTVNFICIYSYDFIQCNWCNLTFYRMRCKFLTLVKLANKVSTSQKQKYSLRKRSEREAAFLYEKEL